MTDRWDGLANRLTDVLQALPENAVFQLYEAAHPADRGRYAQLWRDGAGLHAEISGNEALDPRRQFSPQQQARIVRAGWNPPGGEHPVNWWREVPPTDDWKPYWEMAHGLVLVLVGAFGVTTPEELTYQSWRAGGGGPLFWTDLGIDPLHIEHFLWIGEGDTVENPGALLRRVTIGQQVVDQGFGEAGWEASEALRRAESGQDDRAGQDDRPGGDRPGQLVPIAVQTAQRVIGDWRAGAEGHQPMPRGLRMAQARYGHLDPAGRPRLPETLLPEAERLPVARYLRDAPIVLFSPGYDTDPYDPERPDVVPLNVHTDGAWVWSESLAYFAGRYGHPPEPEFLAHIRQHDYRVPEVSEEAMAGADQFVAGPGR